MSMIDRIIAFCLDNKLVTALIAAGIIAWGVMVAPFDWDIAWLHRSPVAVDAIPDIGENQQIVFTDWMGRSPQDVENQITYPLTVSLLGIPGVKSVRSFSMFGFSTIYVIFNENIEFYWSRTRILEKLSSLPQGVLPPGVKPLLGPDATALGQVFWYTLEGRDAKGAPAGGWDLQELRSIQDWFVRYSLSSAGGVSEVASIGGYVKEYQIDVDPAAMRANDIMIDQVYDAIRKSNIDVGARTIEINQVEYLIRGLGFLKNIPDIENTVVRVAGNTPIRIKDIAKVSLGPALRTGVLDKEGAEAVGGVVVTRFGENPLAVIKNVKKKIAEISDGLPQKTLPDGTVSKVTIVPFYDRAGLIYETLGTLNDAIFQEILVTVLVILIMVNHLGSSVLISSVLPVAVLLSFIGMKLFHVDANIVSLSGIAIAIGTIVDMGIIITENTMKHLARAAPGEPVRDVVFRAASEVGGAVVTAASTTIISLLPVFTMEAAEGKLFKPLAYTKTFAIAASIIVALTLVPPLAHLMFTKRKYSQKKSRVIYALIAAAGIYLMVAVAWWAGAIVLFVSLRAFAAEFLSERWKMRLPVMMNAAVVAIIGLLLTQEWLPLGAARSFFTNLLFVTALVGGFMWLFRLYEHHYAGLLSWILDHKAVFLAPLAVLIVFGFSIWLGFNRVFFFLPGFAKTLPPVVAAGHAIPGLGKEFMPPLDEGSFLLMPTTMVHASLGAAYDILKLQNMRIRRIPEVENVVGKLGRVESALDPAPTSMFETVITVKSEYMLDKNGRRLRFRFNARGKDFARDTAGNLIPDRRGKPLRQWRPEIKTMDDIWKSITEAATVPGATGAPKLQPIAARVVMLQSGMRAPMGIKIKGPDLQTIEDAGIELERALREVPDIDPGTVIADRIVGKPYFEIEIDRDAIARYGLSVDDVQMVIAVAIGGELITTTVEGRERYGVRARYSRELRDDPDAIRRIAVPTASGAQIPLGQLANISYRRGPQMIRSEETFLTSYVLFDKKQGQAEVDVVRSAEAFLKEKINNGELLLPAGVTYAFAGSYENQVRSEKKLAVVLPVALFAIFMILYFQFRRISTTTLVFSGIIIAWAGGFILIWLYGQPWFMDFSLFGSNVRELFHIHQINLSVAIWVGFLALFGIASDDGVLMCTYLDQRFSAGLPSDIKEVRRLTVQAAQRRIRPALMTSATTILALLPVFTSVGRGSDVMVPMAIPSLGGMFFELFISMQAPVLYCMLKERALRKRPAMANKQSMEIKTI